MQPVAQELAHHFRNRAALFGLRAEGGFASGPESRVYLEIADLYKAMSRAADEVSLLARLLDKHCEAGSLTGKQIPKA